MGHATASAHSRLAQPRPATWAQWVLAIALLLVSFGYFVVKPLAERLVSGGLTVLSSVLAQLGETVRRPYSAACLRIELGPDTRALFGEPIVCAPLEDVAWVNPAGTVDSLEFTFAISGPLGQGQAHVFAQAAESEFVPVRIEVTAPSGDTFELLGP